MFVIAEDPSSMPPSASRADIEKAITSARLVGCTVRTIPPDFSRCGDAEGALWHVPAQPILTPGWWIGYIPTIERYEAIYAAALARNIRLLNSPAEHLRVLEFDKSYERLGPDLTPASVVIDHPEQISEAARTLGFPIFVKGAVQSRKSRGWRACVAQDEDELITLCGHLFDLENRSRGRVIARKLVELRHTRIGPGDFPLGREYRVFIYNGEPLAHGYYWEGDDPLAALSSAERDAMLATAMLAAERMEVPLCGVDVGQTTAGEWIVIETNDPQFSGMSQLPRIELWNAICALSR